jgi:hypothetical protein
MIDDEEKTERGKGQAVHSLNPGAFKIQTSPLVAGDKPISCLTEVNRGYEGVVGCNRAGERIRRRR